MVKIEKGLSAYVQTWGRKVPKFVVIVAVAGAVGGVVVVVVVAVLVLGLGLVLFLMDLIDLIFDSVTHF